MREHTILHSLLHDDGNGLYLTDPGDREQLRKELGLTLKFFIDGTDPIIDNRDPSTTEVAYAEYPNAVFSIDLDFAQKLIDNAKENA